MGWEKSARALMINRDIFSGLNRNEMTCVPLYQSKVHKKIPQKKSYFEILIAVACTF